MGFYFATLVNFFLFPFLLAALFMIRSDVNPTVRSKALLVWKTVAANSPKTLRQILPVIITSRFEKGTKGGVNRIQKFNFNKSYILVFVRCQVRIWIKDNLLGKQLVLWSSNLEMRLSTKVLSPSFVLFPLFLFFSNKQNSYPRNHQK